MAAAAGAAILGGLISGNAAKDAANTQADAARDANSLQLQMYNQTREDQAPWRQVGMRALAGLENADQFQRDFNASDMQTDPGYQFRMQEGMKAINNAASARGMGNSGATMKALARYGQDFASNEFGNVYNRFNADRDRRFNRLSSLAGVGQTANSQVAQAGMNYGNQASDNLLSAGAARAAGQVGQANAFNNMLGQGMTAWARRVNQPKPAGPADPNEWGDY